jgi:hypothetical protein
MELHTRWTNGTKPRIGCGRTDLDLASSKTTGSYSEGWVHIQSLCINDTKDSDTIATFLFLRRFRISVSPRDRVASKPVYRTCSCIIWLNEHRSPIHESQPIRLRLGSRPSPLISSEMIQISSSGSLLGKNRWPPALLLRLFGIVIAQRWQRRGCCGLDR